MESKPKITNNRSNESGPCWSQDGRRLIVTSDSRGRPQLYEVSLSTGRLSRIPTNISSHCTEASWNPKDPTRIAFTAAVGGGFQVCEYSFAERKTKVLSKGSRMECNQIGRRTEDISTTRREVPTGQPESYFWIPNLRKQTSDSS